MLGFIPCDATSLHSILHQICVRRPVGLSSTGMVTMYAVRIGMRMAKTKIPGKYLVRENKNETAERTQNLLDTLTFEGEHITYIVTTKGQKLKAPDFDNLTRMANEMETEARREKGKHMEEWEKHLTGSIRRGELGGE